MNFRLTIILLLLSITSFAQIKTDGVRIFLDVSDSAHPVLKYYNPRTGNQPIGGSGGGGITSLNGQTASTQNLAIGTSGIDFNISSSSGTHTFNLPTTSSTARGLVTSSLYSKWTNKVDSILANAANDSIYAWANGVKSSIWLGGEWISKNDPYSGGNILYNRNFSSRAVLIGTDKWNYSFRYFNDPTLVVKGTVYFFDSTMNGVTYSFDNKKDSGSTIININSNTRSFTMGWEGKSYLNPYFRLGTNQTSGGILFGNNLFDYHYLFPQANGSDLILGNGHRHGLKITDPASGITLTDSSNTTHFLRSSTSGLVYDGQVLGTGGGGGGSGTVYSVATNNGTGVTGGTITGSGTIALDTTGVVLTRRSFYQKLDSLQLLNYVTTNTNQTVTGQKNFTAPFILNNTQNFIGPIVSFDTTNVNEYAWIFGTYSNRIGQITERTYTGSTYKNWLEINSPNGNGVVVSNNKFYKNGNVDFAGAVTVQTATANNQAVNLEQLKDSVASTVFDADYFTGAGTTASPLQTNPAAFAAYLQSLPGWSNSTSVVLRGDLTWGAAGGSSLTQLSTPGSFTATPSSTSMALAWADVANESSYKLETSATGTSGWTQIGGTIAANTTSYSHTGLTSSTAYYYRLSAIGDGTTYSNSNYATANATTTSGGGATLEDLTFSPVVGLTNSSGVWTAASGTPGTYTNYGLATKKLAAGQDGYIQWQYAATDGQDAMLTFKTANTNEDYTSGNYKAAAWISSSGATVYRIDANDIAATTATGVINNYYRIERVGSTLTLKTSAVEDFSSGVTTIYTYTFSSSADLYININVDASKKSYHPKGYNLQ
jgi:hypothetical protein